MASVCPSGVLGLHRVPPEAGIPTADPERAFEVAFHGLERPVQCLRRLVYAMADGRVRADAAGVDTSWFS